MAAHRYWRLNITAAGTGALTALAEVEMYASEFGPNLCAGGTASADTTFSGSYLALEAFDGLTMFDEATNASSVWASANAALPHWIAYDFGLGNAHDIQCLGITGRRGASTADNPTAFNLQYSDDGATWFTYWSVSGLTWAAHEFKRILNPGGTPASYSGSPHGAHAYWRVAGVNAADDAFAIAELEMRGSVGGADQCTGGTATASSQFSGSFTPPMAVDNNAATYWHNASGIPYGWLQYQFAAPVEVWQISLQTRPSGSPVAGANCFAVQYSDNGTLWTTAFAVTGETGWALGEIRAYADPNLVTSVTSDLVLDYGIAFAQDVIIDYAVESTTVYNNVVVDYAIKFHQDLVLDYKILQETYNYNAMPLVEGANNGDQLQNPGTVSEINPILVGTPGSVTYPETTVIDPVPGVTVWQFYADWYERIWISPLVIRLSNPKYNTPYAFGVFNAYSVANALVSYVGIDLDEVEITETLPFALARYEYRDFHFEIGTDAAATLNGTFQLTFTFGYGELDVIATIIEIIRSLPELPITEEWIWKTVIATGWNSDEQRTALRKEPRERLEFDILILDELDRRTRYQQLYAYVARDIRMPHFQYAVKLDAAAVTTATKLLFNPAYTNLRDDEYIVLINPQTEATKLVKVATVDVDGATLELPLDEDIAAYWMVVPTVAMRLPDGSGLSMNAIDGSASLKAESTVLRTLLRPGQTATVITYDGLPVMHLRPLANDSVDENFDGGTDVVDNETNLPALYSDWGTPLIEGRREYLAKRPADMDYWRKMGDTLCGSQNPFLLPTYRADLTMLDAASLGQAYLDVNEADYFDKAQFGAYGYLQIETANGIIHRKVTGVSSIAGGTRATLNAALGENPGDNTINRVSFMNLCRLGDDTITLTHYSMETVVSFGIRFINQ